MAVTENRPKLVIGLTGGIGAGKSTVARLLEDGGVRVIDSDHLNHEELKDPAVIAKLVEWFGGSICAADGSIDRAELAEVVFGDPEARARVEGLLHPRIDRRRRVLLAQHNRDASVQAIAIDSPLLYEAGLDAICDLTVFVDAPADQRRRRVASERGWSTEELARREKSQKPLDSKRAVADHIVVNNSGRDELRRRVEKLLSELLNEASE